MKKIERKQTRDHITQMLRYEILSGSMKPGDELAQESIAEHLGVSGAFAKPPYAGRQAGA